MPLTNGTIGVWLARLPAAPQRVLLLDYDGTLAPFTPLRAEAQPYPGVAGALEELLHSGRTRLVFVTGRSVAELVRLLPLAGACEIWGCHGLERRHAGGAYQQQPLAPEAEAALIAAQREAERRGWSARLEQKPGCVALHWRGLAPQAGRRMARAAHEAWSVFAAGTGLELKSFDQGLELRSAAFSKADAVNALVLESGPGAAIAYLGDDLTDEDAFAALAGAGLGVLVRQEYRETAAQAWLVPPAELLSFLAAWSAA